MVLRCSSRRTGTVATQTEHFQEIGTDISFLIPTNKPLHRSGVRTVSDGRFTRCSPRRSLLKSHAFKQSILN